MKIRRHRREMWIKACKKHLFSKVIPMAKFIFADCLKSTKTGINHNGRK